MVAVIDYDAGNTLSVMKAVSFLGDRAVLTDDRDVILGADRVILPGVGAFGDAVKSLNERHLTDVIKEAAESGRPFLGICLGQQLLFEESEESPGVKGLGILEGKVLKIPDKEGLKVPQIGWNSLELSGNGRLFKNVKEGSFVYFVHSYYCHAADREVVKASCEYGVTVDASVEKGNVFGCQFHPEKSSDVGMSILTEFLRL